MAGERLEKSLRAYRKRYAAATRQERTTVLTEFCRLGGYHRKYAIALLGRRHDDEQERPRRRRGATYSSAALKVVEQVWEAAGYPWSQRLKALLPIWLPWARGHLSRLDDPTGRQVLAISARQIDRRLADRKRRLKRRLYGRTKPGTLLKHQVPIKAEPWDVQEPGYAEIDLVSHSGPSASGEFAYTLNLTDVHTGWCESRAILGRSQETVVRALDAIRRSLPFPLRAIDSDNGSEFINHHLIGYCRAQGLIFTRGRPYKKDDNARIEQKNWTHVRRLIGYERYDSPQEVSAMNQIYSGDLRVMMNLYQPSVKLIERKRIGARIRRRYDAACTPLDRLMTCHTAGAQPSAVLAMLSLRERTDPFELSQSLDGQITRLHARQSEPVAPARRPAPLSPQRGRAALSSPKEKAYA